MLLPPPLKPAREEARPAAPNVPPVVTTYEIDDGDEHIAFLDLETTGLDPARHDIIEIGLVLVSAKTLTIVQQHSVRVRPERLEQAEAEALAINGYDERAWKDAVSLREALEELAPLIEGTLVAGHNVGFDWSFLEAGFKRASLPLPEVDYHRLDTASLAWPLHSNHDTTSLSLSEVCRYLGIYRPSPHRALDDARCAYEVAFRMHQRVSLGDRIRSLPEDEEEITTTLLERLERGRREYGAWDVHDGRDYESEALEEMLDGLHYLAAAVVRRRQQREHRRRRVYVCHPFSHDPAGNIERVRAISGHLVASGYLPIAPHLFLPQFVDEATDRETALDLCVELLATCDEVRVYGGIVTEGMERELREAKRLGILAHFVREVLA